VWDSKASHQASLSLARVRTPSVAANHSSHASATVSNHAGRRYGHSANDVGGSLMAEACLCLGGRAALPATGLTQRRARPLYVAHRKSTRVWPETAATACVGLTDQVRNRNVRGVAW
jgi:hypothetical protein